MNAVSKREPSQRMRQRRGRGAHRQQLPVAAKWPVRLLLLVLVFAAVLVILLRMAEFTGRRVHRRSPPARISMHQLPLPLCHCPNRRPEVIVT
jgi:hypothetical protein